MRRSTVDDIPDDGQCAHIKTIVVKCPPFVAMYPIIFYVHPFMLFKKLYENHYKHLLGLMALAFCKTGIETLLNPNR